MSTLGDAGCSRSREEYEGFSSVSKLLTVFGKDRPDSGAATHGESVR